MGDNTSPILLTNVPQPIATFNRPFELSELVGNLDGVMYLYSGEAVNVTCVSDVEEGETKYFLAYDNGQAHIGELSVDGNTLLCSEKGEENYLFDLDFKHQNLKFFEQASGTYAIALPWLGLDADSKVLISVYRDTSGNIITIHYVDNDYRAWGYAGETIREISWFNQLLTSANVDNIVSLIQMLINLEYNTEAIDGIFVENSGTKPTQVDGDWNLFTDGSPFIPLRIVSRFPNGSPVYTNSSDLITLCEFNRVPTYGELDYKLTGIVKDSIGIHSGVFLKTSAGPSTILQIQNSSASQAIIDGVYLKARYGGMVVSFFDIDLDHQFRRSLPAGFIKMNVQIPQLLDNPSAGQGFGIMHDSEGQENFGVCTAQDNAPYIIEGNTWSSEKGGWANSLTWANVQSLLQAIIAMEFEGFDVEPPLIDPVDYRESLATGFIVTPLIPQTLS